MKAAKNTAAAVTELISPVVESLGCSLWDIEYVKEGADMILRITIDKEGGIDITDCEAVSRAIDPMLDEAEVIDGTYVLEVSSPGVERELRIDRHYLACIGETVKLMLFAPLEGRRHIEGTLIALENGIITVKEGESEIKVDKSAVSKAQTVFDWSTAK